MRVCFFFCKGVTDPISKRARARARPPEATVGKKYCWTRESMGHMLDRYRNGSVSVGDVVYSCWRTQENIPIDLNPLQGEHLEFFVWEFVKPDREAFLGNFTHFTLVGASDWSYFST